MAAVEEARGSANSSQDSKDSGGQKSMLELLSITDAAVKALNKSAHSTSSTGSRGSKKSHNSDQGVSDPLMQSTHSERSVKSAQSGQSIKSAHSGQSMKSVQSGQSMKSTQSQKSSHSVPSHRSVHSSHSQEDNLGAKLFQPLQDVSHDSGVISKTHTISENKNKPREVTPTVSPEGASDVSTTASDILIQSTHERSTHGVINGENGLLENVSATSKCSKTSFGVENFNSSGPQKVKISKRRLKEIKSPFEEEELRSSASSDEKVPSSLLSADGKSKRGSRTNSERSSESKSGKSETGSQSSENGALRKAAAVGNQPVQREVNGYNGAKWSDNKPQGIYEDHFRVEKVRKSTEKAYDDVNLVNRNGNTNASHGGARKESGGASRNNKPANGSTNDEAKMPSDLPHFGSTPKYFVERHTPQKVENKKQGEVNVPSIPERKNLLQDLEDSVEIITSHGKDMSSSSSQSEIVTVQERIVTVTAKDVGSPASTVSEVVMGSKLAPPLVSYHSAGRRVRDDVGNLDNDGEDKKDDNDVPPALPRQFKKPDDFEAENPTDKFDGSKPMYTRSQWFSKQATGHGLLQGAPVSGHDAPDKPSDVEIHISDFKLTDKQRMVKESFAKRQGGPIRRVVQPRLVGHDSKSSSTSSAGEQKPKQDLGQSNDQILTAAAAASAAVAATQPFLKAQYEMEARMAELVEKINELQRGGGVKGAVPGDGDRVAQLERKLKETTEQRIDYMEKLQEQQMAMQAKLLSMTRDAGSRPSAGRSAPHSPESHIYIHTDSQKPSTTTQNKAFSKTTVHRSAPKGDYSERVQKYSSLDQDESLSPLHTPAPRSRAPKPTVYDTSDIEFKSRALSPKAKSPRAKSPKMKGRSRSKSPFKENQDHGILHQILASAHTPPSRDPGLYPSRQPVLQERTPFGVGVSFMFVTII